MGEIKLHFSKQEKITILERKGYKIENIKSWHSTYEGHRAVEEDQLITIAYHPDHVILSETERQSDVTTLDSRYGLDTVFAQIVKAQFMDLLLGSPISSAYIYEGNPLIEKANLDLRVYIANHNSFVPAYVIDQLCKMGHEYWVAREVVNKYQEVCKAIEDFKAKKIVYGNRCAVICCQ